MLIRVEASLILHRWKLQNDSLKSYIDLIEKVQIVKMQWLAAHDHPSNKIANFCGSIAVIVFSTIQVKEERWIINFLTDMDGSVTCFVKHDFSQVESRCNPIAMIANQVFSFFVYMFQENIDDSSTY